jgi:homoserine dehydrogenase
VGGGIPIIRVLREGLAGNRTRAIYGILNGTCNYILTRMAHQGLPFEQALQEAQRQGYAEADPTLDVDGHDTAHKAVILASLAYGFHVPLRDVSVEGIRGLAGADIRYAADLGYRIKLLAVIRAGEDADGRRESVEVRVHPTLVPAGHVLASVSGVYNAVMVRSDLAGDTLYYGHGAGREPTASTVIGDICDVARNLAGGALGRVPALAETRNPPALKPVCDIRTRYYLRLTVEDEPGVLARFARILGEHGISIASVLQKEATTSGRVPVVILTHEALESEIAEAMRKIDKTDIAQAPSVRLRIEE